MRVDQNFDKLKGAFVAPVWLAEGLEPLLAKLRFRRWKPEDKRARLIVLSSIVKAATSDQDSWVWWHSKPLTYDNECFPVARTSFTNTVEKMKEIGWVKEIANQKSVDNYTKRWQVSDELLSMIPPGLVFEQLKEKREFRKILICIGPSDDKRDRSYKNQDPATIAELSKQVDDINACILRHGVTGLLDKSGEEKDFLGYYRRYKGDLSSGGRLYGGCETQAKETRGGIRIGGEVVVEVDITASHPTLLHAQRFDPLDMRQMGDLYEDIAAIVGDPGVDRKTIKAVLNPLIGRQELYRRWPPGTKVKGVPFQIVQEAILQVVPEAHPEHPNHQSPLWLQNLEADILVDAMWGLARYHEVPTLGLHDCIICRERDVEQVTHTFSQSFWYRGRVYPKLKAVKWVDGEKALWRVPLTTH